jgi:Zinc binding domain
MNDCCSSSSCDNTHPKKHRCPSNGNEYSEVSVRTIIHHIKEAWTWQPTAHRYFFCDDPACEVVYFGDDGSMISRSQLRTCVGAKELSDNSLLCYCYGVTKAEFLANRATKDFVVAQTKAGLCSCDTSNPSGRCCLKDFPRH